MPKPKPQKRLRAVGVAQWATADAAVSGAAGCGERRRAGVWDGGAAGSEVSSFCNE